MQATKAGTVARGGELGDGEGVRAKSEGPPGIESQELKV